MLMQVRVQRLTLTTTYTHTYTHIYTRTYTRTYTLRHVYININRKCLRCASYTFLITLNSYLINALKFPFRPNINLLRACLDRGTGTVQWATMPLQSNHTVVFCFSSDKYSQRLFPYVFLPFFKYFFYRLAQEVADYKFAHSYSTFNTCYKVRTC